MKTLAEMRDRREAVMAQLRALVVEERDLTDEEKASFDALTGERETLDADIAAAEAREADAERTRLADEDRAKKIAQLRAQAAPATIAAEPQVYGKGSRNSYFLDLCRISVPGQDPEGDAQARLLRHGAELRTLLPEREARRGEKAGTQLTDHLGERLYSQYEKHGVSPFEREVRVNPNRTDGQGGYFVPPLWLVDQFVPLARAGRAFAEIVPQFDLPAGTDSINIPKIATGTTTAIQTADGASVSSTDLTDTFISAPVRTIAGQQDIAIQLLEQSPISFDEVVLRDLLADYNSKLDTQLFTGTGSNGQVKGIDNVSSINTATYTDASPTLGELFPYFGQSASLISTNRKQPPTAFLLHSRRWYWALGQVDTTNRPLVDPNPDVVALSPAAIASGLVSEGPVGTIIGVPVVIDQNITTTAGAGSNQDTIYAVRSSDFFLWEGNIRTRVLTEILSGTLQVRVQIYNYFAFLAERYAASITKVDGTGLILSGW